MRLPIVPLVLVLFAPTIHAQERAPQALDRPAEDASPLEPELGRTEVDQAEEELEAVPRPIEPREVEDGDDDGGEEGDDGQGRAPPRGGSLLPVPDTRTDALGGPFWGSTTGCALGGCGPGIGFAGGTGALIAFLGAPLTGTCAALGVLVGAPAAIVLGPCASGSAAAGGLVGAVADDRDAVPIIIGALPGIAVGILGSAGTIWGLLELGAANGETVLPVTILAISAAASLSAGPVSIAGIAIADTLAGPSESETREASGPGARAPAPVVVTGMRH
jgi:hypothetical protein